jgi:chaperone modulatory protein CbpM
MTPERDEALWLYAEGRVTMDELAQFSGLPDEVLKELVDYGVLRSQPAGGEPAFAADCVMRLRAAARLRNDLELDTPALALALSFLERIHSLENELRRLEARLARPRR